MRDIPIEDSPNVQDAHQSLSSIASSTSKGWAQAISTLKGKLIDTSKRNRLIHSPIGKKRGKYLDIVDERSDEIFRLLVHGQKKMQFVHCADGVDEPEIMENIFIPDPDPPSQKHTDLKLQTNLTMEALHKRLLQLYRDANSSIEEQGVNPLFLALGFVRWFESESSETERFAPLVLLPVELIREGVRSNFRLQLRDQDLEPNESFDAFLRSDFDLKLPAWPETDEWLPSEYFRKVNPLVTSQQRWSLLADVIQLGFYSSGKFLMSRDLDNADPENPLMQQLLCDGFGESQELFDPQENLDDRYVNPQDLGHVMAADASQTRVIAAAKEKRNMVIQGPPGTGKSQTIANIIAVSVRAGQKVLFVAEKRAALEVVHDRLSRCGLGPLCLEMHSTKKTGKKAVYAELNETLDLGKPKKTDHAHYDQLRKVRDELNELSNQLHEIDELTQETPYRVMGQLTKLMANRDLQKPDYHVEHIATWDKETAIQARRDVELLAELSQDFGHERSHDWRGANKKMTPMKRERLGEQIQQLQERLTELNQHLESACQALSSSPEGDLTFADKVVMLLRLMKVRPLDVDDLVCQKDVMQHCSELQHLFEEIILEQTRHAELEKAVMPSAFEYDWTREHYEIDQRKTSLMRWFYGSYRAAVK